MPETHYRLNRPSVVAETIERETIILNLQSGCYYSLLGSGFEILALIDAIGDVDQVVASLQARHGVPADELRGHVSTLVASLVSEGLIVSGPNMSFEPGETLDAPGGAFEPPVLSKFDDLKDLLLADPIHDVGEGGWPSQKPADSKIE
jgi:hypothetical protein